MAGRISSFARADRLPPNTPGLLQSSRDILGRSCFPHPGVLACPASIPHNPLKIIRNLRSHTGLFMKASGCASPRCGMLDRDMSGSFHRGEVGPGRVTRLPASPHCGVCAVTRTRRAAPQGEDGAGVRLAQSCDSPPRCEMLDPETGP